MRRIVSLVFVLCAAAGGFAGASAPPQSQAVLAVEQRWVTALAKHDRAALGAILAPEFAHVNYRGELRYREDELADIGKRVAYVQQPGEQTVDFAAGLAFVRGVNTVRQNGKIVMRLRYTDVYQLVKGRWMAISAQETAISAAK